MSFCRLVRRSVEMNYVNIQQIIPITPSTYINITDFGQHTEDVTVKRSVVLIQRRLAPTTWMETPLRTFWYGRVQTWYAKCWVAWWRAKSLHADKPWGRC